MTVAKQRQHTVLKPSARGLTLWGSSLRGSLDDFRSLCFLLDVGRLAVCSRVSTGAHVGLHSGHTFLIVFVDFIV